MGTSDSLVITSKASFWRTRIRTTSSCLTFLSKSSPHITVTYIRFCLDFGRSFPPNIRVVCSDETNCTLIALNPKWSIATYLDPDRESNKDYTYIKKVLDEALSRYSKSGVTFKKEAVRYGAHVFTHVTKFACVKQPPDGQKDAYYAIHHMREFVRDQQQLTLPADRKHWAERLSEIQDADLRQEFFRIQSELAGIISEDVLRNTGEFYLNNQLSNREIDTMLILQADSDRSFMTITKDGGFTHPPARERSQDS